MIYFAQRKSGGPIKIGTSVQLAQRIITLRREHGADLEVLGVVTGSYKEESALHERFDHLHHEKEWFHPGEDLLVFISADARPWDGTDEVPSKTVPLGIEISADCYELLIWFCKERKWTKRAAVEYLIEKLWEKQTGRKYERPVEKTARPSLHPAPGRPAWSPAASRGAWWCASPARWGRTCRWW